MKKYRYLIVSMLAVPSMVFAQQPPPGPQTRPAPGGMQRPGGGQPDRPRPERPNPGRPNPGGPGPGQGNRPSPGGPNRPNPGGGHHRPNPGRPNPGRPETKPTPGRPTPGRPNPGNGHRPNPGKPGRPGYHRPGEGRPPQFRPIRGPGFRYPHGYRYRRWTTGLLLPSIFLSSAYIYHSWGLLGLEPPPPGYYWVRYGPDLLLVQRGTRRIADVIYGAFL